MLNMFHLYGLIIGFAILMSVWLIEKKSTQRQIRIDVWQTALWVIIPAIICARFYHVFTDIKLYQSQWWQIFYIWNGGLSIVGAILGGALGLVAYKLFGVAKISWMKLADLVVFGLPFGQAIGRWGNYVNQEIYGKPTTFPWAIFIDVGHRLPGYQQFTTYHPLFIYEALLMLIFGMGVWLFDYSCQRKNIDLLGKGKFLSAYLLFYGVVRFNLEFLRIQNNFWGWLSINQWLSFCFIIIGISIFIRSEKYDKT